MDVPPNHARLTFTFTLTGTTRIYQTSLDMKQGTSVDAANFLTIARPLFTGTNRPFSAGFILAGMTLAEVKCSWVNSVGTLFTAIDTTVVTGTKTGNGMSINTSVLLRKNVAPAGRKFRGRMMLPPLYFIESDVTQAGQIDPTPLGLYSTAWALTYSSLALDYQPVLLHSDGFTTPTLITSFTVLPRVGTIGKRMRGR